MIFDPQRWIEDMLNEGEENFLYFNSLQREQHQELLSIQFQSLQLERKHMQISQNSEKSKSTDDIHLNFFQKVDKKATHNFLQDLKPKIRNFFNKYSSSLQKYIFQKSWKSKKSTNIKQFEALFWQKDLNKAFQEMFDSRYLNREVAAMRFKDLSKRKAYLKVVRKLQASFRKGSFTYIW